MKLGIIGFSNYVQRAYAQYLYNQKTIKLSAVCDLRPSKKLKTLIAKSIPDALPQMFTDIKEFLEFEEMDAVLISTPHAFHYEQAHACLNAGLHVYVDKPLACGHEDGKQLVDLAMQKGLVLAVGNQRRYEAPYQALKENFTKGDLGETSLVHYLFANSPWYDYRKTWRGDPAMNCGGPMIDIGHLAADMIVWLLDKPLKWVEADALSSDMWPAEHTVLVNAEFQPQITVNLTVTYLTPFPSVQEELSIYGSQCCLFTRRFSPARFSKSPPIYTKILADGKVDEIVFTNKPEPWRPFEDFCNGVQTGKKVLSDGASNLQTIEFVENTYRSIQEKKRIHVSNDFS